MNTHDAQQFLNTNNSQFFNLVLSYFNWIYGQEQQLLSNQRFRSTLVSRIFSTLSLLFFLYLTTLPLMFIGNYLISSLLNLSSTEPLIEYWWSVALVIGMPIFLQLCANFFNREYILSYKIMRFLETFKYSKIKVGSFSFFIEIIVLVLFVVSYTFVLLLALAFFINFESLESLLNFKSAPGIFFVVAITVYLTFRIFLIDETNLIQKYYKAKRSFFVWLFATGITFVFVICDLVRIESLNSFYFPYSCITLLLAMEKLIQSYSILRNVLDEIMDCAYSSEN